VAAALRYVKETAYPAIYLFKDVGPHCKDPQVVRAIRDLYFSPSSRLWTLILIDAASDGKPPGTVSRITPRFAADFPKSLVAHDIGLKDLIESAVLLGGLPKVDLITVSIGEIQPMTLEPSPAASAAFPAIQAAVEACLG